MDKRSIQVVLLVMFLITLFYAFLPKPQPKPKLAESADIAAQTAGQPGPAAVSAKADDGLGAPLPVQGRAAEKQVVVETPFYTARFNTRGGQLESLKLKNYLVYKENTDWGKVLPFLSSLLGNQQGDPTETMEMVKRELAYGQPFSLAFEGDADLTREVAQAVYHASADSLKVEGQPADLVLTAKLGNGLAVVKTLTFHPDGYRIDFKSQLVNYAARPLGVKPLYLMGEGPLSHHDGSRSHMGPVYMADESVDTEETEGLDEPLQVEKPVWAGFSSTFFLTAVQHETPVARAFYRPVKLKEDHQAVFYGLVLPPVEIEPKRQVISRFKVYMGPKDVGQLKAFGGGLEESLDLTLETLATPLTGLLRWLYGFAGNYGVAIILLTVLVRVVLFPLTYKGMFNMKRMQKLQPKVAALKDKYKNDRERFGKELMGLYKKHKVNPLSGCLPMILQIPIFFALYSALMGAIELRHAPFALWLTDLSAKDGLYVLPLLMGATMFAQQKMSPPPPDPVQAKLFMFLPLIFTLFMFNFPSGLTLYWTVSNLLSIGQQAIINRVHIPEPKD